MKLDDAIDAPEQPTADGGIVDAICNNMYAQYSRYGAVLTGSSDAMPGVGCVRSGRPVCNYVLGASFSPGEARERVAQVTEMVRGWRVSALWQIGPEASPPEVVELATDCGWALISPCAGMAIELDAPVSDAPKPNGLTISTAEDEEALRTWVGIYFSAAPQDYKDSVADIITELGCGSHRAWTYFIGYLGDKAVASSMIFARDGVAGLYYIGTLPEYRRQGIGMAMTRYSLRQAQRLGNCKVVLQATDMGAGIYRRAGFQEYCKISMLVLRA